MTYDFTPTDFVQINAEINAAMVSQVIALLNLDQDSRVLDLYCGLGNFTLPLARRAAAVLGIEGDAALVERARHNALMNGLSNAQFLTADLTQALPGMRPTWPRASATWFWIRRGPGHWRLCQPSHSLRRAKSHTFHATPGVSRETFAVLVHEYGFTLRAAGVLDMFPHTAHVESLAVLTPP